MGGVSSKAVNTLSSRKKFNGNELQQNEFSDGSGLDFYDFNARTYDQQIGRFIQIDPETEFLQESFSPFHFGINNPILHNDPDGKNPIGLTYKIIRALSKVVEWSTSQSTVAPTAMTPGFLRDGTTVVKNIIDLQSLKEIKSSDVNGKTETNKSETKGGTYVLKDEEGKIQRTGRTNDLNRREAEHARNEKTKDLEFQIDKKTDNKDAQRGREQQIHEKHNPPLNKIKPISDKNPNKQKYLEAANELEKNKNKT